MAALTSLAMSERLKHAAGATKLERQKQDRAMKQAIPNAYLRASCQCTEKLSPDLQPLSGIGRYIGVKNSLIQEK